MKTLLVAAVVTFGISASANAQAADHGVKPNKEETNPKPTMLPPPTPCTRWPLCVDK